jgi:hypothetical protein
MDSGPYPREALPNIVDACGVDALCLYSTASLHGGII